jgi:hypothetical protein
MLMVLLALALVCGLALVMAAPRAAFTLWILALETSPDSWLDSLIGGHETIIGAMKAFGLALALILVVQDGARRDRYNPGFAFLAMFGIGLMHGLYPGLTLLGSVRSLIGSAGPFLFSFVRLRPAFILAVERATIWGPLVTIGFGGLLAALGLDHMYVIEQGALRLGASGEPPFLAGFALIGVYAGLMAMLVRPTAWQAIMVAINITIILLTGARTPLLLAGLVTIGALIIQRRLISLAAVTAIGAIALMFTSSLGFLRVVTLTQLGEAGNLSNRDLVWPYFQAAFAASPWVGWGVGAGKVVIPVTSSLTALIGTNAAHDEYLRIGTEGGALGLIILIALITLWVLRNAARLPPAQAALMRLIFLGFAFHSATDNTLIATTSSVFFIWVSSVFASVSETPKATA